MSKNLNVEIVSVKVVSNNLDEIFCELSEKDSKALIGDLTYSGPIDIRIKVPRGSYKNVLDYLKVDEYEAIDVVSGKMRKGTRIETDDGAIFSESVS